MPPVNPPTPHLILGTGSIGSPLDPQVRFRSPAEIRALLDAFHARGGRVLDTARGYSPGAPGTGERALGEAEAELGLGARWSVDTKVLFGEGSRQEGAGEAVRRAVVGEEDGEGEGEGGSLRELGVEKINTLYLHAPLPSTIPPSAILPTITALHATGRIARFGLSNHTAAQVADYIALADRDGGIRPSVCQENYSVVMRGVEERLLPMLRKEGISLYAYSPAAGGFLSAPDYQARPYSRWDQSTKIGASFTPLYHRPHLIRLASRIRALAAQHHLTGHALALRWTAYHSCLSSAHGDAIVLGASSVEQLHENLDAIEMGPLPEECVNEVEEAWRVSRREREVERREGEREKERRKEGKL